MSSEINKGAIGVTELLDNIPGIDKLITEKKTIPESKEGWGGLEFKLKSKGTIFKHSIFLNFNDLYDVTANGKTIKNMFVNEVNQLLTWVVAWEDFKEEE